MAINDEDLMQQLQRATMLMRRTRRERAARPEGASAEGRPAGDGGGACGHSETRGGEPRGGEARRGGRHGQLRLLALLAARDGVSQKDLAALLGVRAQSLSEMLDKLEDEGCVQRQRDGGDKRLVNVHLTAEGRERAERAAERRRQNAADLFSPLSDDEKAQLSAILAKMTAPLEERLADFPQEA